MKAPLRALAVVVAAGVAGLFVLPFLVASVVAGQVQQATDMAASWDVPPELIAGWQAAAQRAGIPWFLLAGIASVATDFARHAPDGTSRTTIFPRVAPPIVTAPGGDGMFLVARRQAAAAGVDPQDVAQAADWLAARLAGLGHGNPLAGGSLNDPTVSRWWLSLLSGAPLVIGAIAANGADPGPVAPGDNPIRPFGAAVMAAIGAPVTAANLGAFAAWAAGEGTCARFNPLATTQPEPGATPFNNLSGGGHVWNYPSFAVGVQATTTALTNGRYQPVIAAFWASAGVAAVADAVERSPWGTRHFGSPTYPGRACGTSPGPPGPSSGPPMPTITGPDAIAATIVARAARYELTWAQLSVLAPGQSQ